MQLPHCQHAANIGVFNYPWLPRPPLPKLAPASLPDSAHRTTAKPSSPASSPLLGQCPNTAGGSLLLRLKPPPLCTREEDLCLMPHQPHCTHWLASATSCTQWCCTTLPPAHKQPLAAPSFS